MIKQYPENIFPLLTKPGVLLATWFGIGFFPRAPGSLGSLVAVMIAWPVSYYLGWTALLVATVVVFFLGIWSANQFSKFSGEHDSGSVVIDEVCGQWLTLLLIPPDFIMYAIGFMIFRALDIIKPWPINVVDQRIKGGIGVMLDDVIAGLVAALFVWNIWMWLEL